MWSAINAALTGCFDLLLWPFAWAPVWLQLAVMAVPATAVMLVVFRFCSNQAALDAAKDKIKAYLLELWLYRDDLRVSLLAKGRLVLWNLRYLRHLLVPITVASVPIVPRNKHLLRIARHANEPWLRSFRVVAGGHQL